MSTSISVADEHTLDYLKDIYNDLFDFQINKNTKHIKHEDNKLILINDDKVLNIDFASREILSRIDPKAKKCSVIQAVEGRNKNKLKILDTTAGLGRDTFTLASRGHTVISIEKDQYIYILLQHALEQAKSNYEINDIAQRITFINMDSCEFLNSTLDKYDSIYIDPMFPERKKNAKVKQDMQILHNIAYNDDSSNDAILELVIKNKITKKAIVKRPIAAEFLANKKPSSQLKGKTNRFDIYTI